MVAVHHARNPRDLSGAFVIDYHWLYWLPLLDLSLATQCLLQDRVATQHSNQEMDRSHLLTTIDNTRIAHRSHYRNQCVRSDAISITVHYLGFAY